MSDLDETVLICKGKEFCGRKSKANQLTWLWIRKFSDTRHTDCSKHANFSLPLPIDTTEV